MGKESGRPRLNHVENAGREVQNPSMAITREIPDASKNVIERNFNIIEAVQGNCPTH